MVAIASDPSLIFLTGDLGFMALEPLQHAMGQRFINAGLAEQNMISVAAGLAREGLSPWCYSIAPFCYARAFEQIRNDACFHGLPVKLVGNGGGYGYGVMGPTHHAIEDYGVLLTLPDAEAWIPVFNEDVARVVELAMASPRMSYIRLGRGEVPAGFCPPPFAPWRQLLEGQGPPVVALGPLAGCYLGVLQHLPVEQQPSLWAAGYLPVATLPDTLIGQIDRHGRLIVAEEHVAQGSFASQLALFLMKSGLGDARLTHLHALKHNYGRYGSQSYLRQHSGLDPASLLRELNPT